MAAANRREKILWSVVGVLSVLFILLLTGAATSPHPGRYQLESIVKNNTVQLYVMDTATGRVKWVDDMNVSFEAMKGD